MVPEYWQLGEDLQDALRGAGYDSDTVEGIAVDVHDLLQAADRLRDELVPALIQAPHDPEALANLHLELRHLAWHAVAAQAYLDAVERTLRPQ
jgi:hypothetical protein